jgi:hypothetical protein
MPKQTQTKTQTQTQTASKSKKVKQVEEPVEEAVVEEVVEEVEEVEVDAEDAEAEVDEAEEADEADGEAEVADGKKKKKVEFTCESSEEALAELVRVDSEIEAQIKYRKAVFKTYQKLVSKQLKASKKRSKNSSTTPREANGFIKAKAVPSRFRAFYEAHLKEDAAFTAAFPEFNIAVDQPRTDITKIIYHYIKTNELYGKHEDGSLDKRTIVPDEVLTELLNVAEDETIGFNNFQTYISRLYAEAVAEEEVAEEEVAEEEVAEEVAEVVAPAKTKGSKAKSATKN